MNFNLLPGYSRKKNEVECLEKMDIKDRESMLIYNNMRLVLNIAKKYGGEEDCVSEGFVGLIRAAKTFKTDQNTQFSTYAAICIKNQINMYLRNQRSQVECVSIYKAINVDNEGNEFTIEDSLADNKDWFLDIEKQESIKLLYSVLNNLPDRERKIITMLYGLEGKRYKQKEVAELLGISQSYVSRLEKNILEKIRRMIVKNDY